MTLKIKWYKGSKAIGNTLESDQEKLDLITSKSGFLFGLYYNCSFMRIWAFSSIKFSALLEEWLCLMFALNKVNSKYFKNTQLIELNQVGCLLTGWITNEDTVVLIRYRSLGRKLDWVQRNHMFLILPSFLLK